MASAFVIVTGAMCTCTGAMVPAPMPVNVPPPGLCKSCMQPVATSQDMGLVSFGACRSTPPPAGPGSVPCVQPPIIWTPGNPLTKVGGKPIMTMSSKGTCPGLGGLGPGSISFTFTPTQPKLVKG